VRPHQPCDRSEQRVRDIVHRLIEVRVIQQIVCLRAKHAVVNSRSAKCSIRVRAVLRSSIYLYEQYTYNRKRR